MAGTPWPVNVYYQPPRGHDDRRIRSMSHDQPRLTFQGRVGHHPASILFDTGATGVAYINPACCQRLGLTPRKATVPSRRQQRRLHRLLRLARATGGAVDPTEFKKSMPDPPYTDTVILADGTKVPTQGIVQVPLAIQGYRETVTCVVINLADDYDIILGDAWLYEHAGIIDYRQGVIRLVSRGRELTLRLPVQASQPSQASSPSSTVSRLCSFRSALRALHSGSPVYLALVRRVGDLPEGDAPGPSHSPWTPPWLGALREEGTIPPS